MLELCVFSFQISKTTGNVFATDTILATLMCATRSNNSWDIVVHKIGDKLFFDKRDNTFGNLTKHYLLLFILVVQWNESKSSFFPSHRFAYSE